MSDFETVDELLLDTYALACLNGPYSIDELDFYPPRKDNKYEIHFNARKSMKESNRMYERRIKQQERCL